MKTDKNCSRPTSPPCATSSDAFATPKARCAPMVEAKSRRGARPSSLFGGYPTPIPALNTIDLTNQVACPTPICRDTAAPVGAIPARRRAVEGACHRPPMPGSTTGATIDSNRPARHLERTRLPRGDTDRPRSRQHLFDKPTTHRHTASWGNFYGDRVLYGILKGTSNLQPPLAGTSAPCYPS